MNAFVDGERWATGIFIGRRLRSREHSPAASDLPPTAEQPTAEALFLGSRGAQDYWPGRLCDMRVWGSTTAAADLHRRKTRLPSASLVREEPPEAFKITVPPGGGGVQRLRVHAPMSDSPLGNVAAAVGDGMAAVATADDDSSRRKAYYEVCCRRIGCAVDLYWVVMESDCLFA